MSLAKLFFKALETSINKEMVYKWNFIIKIFSLMSIDIVAPIITILIYSTTLGIPGWTFEQFILFQGTFIFVMGMNRVFQIVIAWKTVYEVREGTFDKFLTKPYNPLTYLTVTSFDLEGLGELFVGIFLLIWAFVKLSIPVLSVNFLIFVILIAVALLFTYSLMVLIGALAFLVVKSHGLFNIFFNLVDMARYPSSIYSYSLQFFVSFLFPVAVASTFPAIALLQGYGILDLFKIIAPVLIFFGISLLLWSLAIKKYSSAGG